MSKITGGRLLEALRAAGLADDNTRRVVIDIEAECVPVVYIERWGDERLLDVVTAVAAAQITVKEA